MGIKVQEILLLLFMLIFIGCAEVNKPAVVDPCKNAPTECWADKGINPNTIPVCVELIKCSSWTMTAE